MAGRRTSSAAHIPLLPCLPSINVQAAFARVGQALPQPIHSGYPVAPSVTARASVSAQLFLGQVSNNVKRPVRDPHTHPRATAQSGPQNFWGPSPARVICCTTCTSSAETRARRAARSARANGRAPPSGPCDEFGGLGWRATGSMAAPRSEPCEPCTALWGIGGGGGGDVSGGLHRSEGGK
jgi:hypothetical protein